MAFVAVVLENESLRGPANICNIVLFSRKRASGTGEFDGMIQPRSGEVIAAEMVGERHEKSEGCLSRRGGVIENPRSGASRHGAASYVPVGQKSFLDALR